MKLIEFNKILLGKYLTLFLVITFNKHIFKAFYYYQENRMQRSLSLYHVIKW